MLARAGHKSRKTKKEVGGQSNKTEFPEIERLKKEVKKITSQVPIKSKINENTIQSPANIEFALPNVEIDGKDK